MFLDGRILLRSPVKFLAELFSVLFNSGLALLQDFRTNFLYEILV